MYVIQKQGQWFRVSDDMVNNATDVNACGTKYGIWMKGISKRTKCARYHDFFRWKRSIRISLSLGVHPSSNDGIVERKACVPGNGIDCFKSYSIKVKRCENSTVYFLPRPSACPEAYCFGISILLPFIIWLTICLRYITIHESVLLKMRKIKVGQSCVLLFRNDNLL